MFNGKSILAVIPARGGSKGLSRKNILPLCGKPLLAWTIDAARKSGVIDRIIVSTDDSEIASVAHVYGADIPFVRPTALASDTAKGMDVLLHAMSWVEINERAYDFLCCLQPTSPLRISEDILNALDVLEKKNALSIVSVCEAEHSPLWCNRLQDDLSLTGFIRESVNANRQEFGTYYRLNGAIYLADWKYLLKHKTWYRERSYAYVMPRERSVDIDTVFDMHCAEAAMMRQQKDSTI